MVVLSDERMVRYIGRTEKSSVSKPVTGQVVSGKVRNADAGVAAKVNLGTTLSRRVPKSMESLFQTRPVSNRSSMVKTAFASPGMESLLAKENADSLATDEVVDVVVLLSQAERRITRHRLDKMGFICFIPLLLCKNYTISLFLFAYSDKLL